jgi:hypothetical protein
VTARTSRTIAGRLHRRRAAPVGMDFDVAELLVNAAVRAPSVHDTRPWRVVYDRHGSIELWADWSRLPPAVDPAGRELVISCGSALAVLQLGVRWLGYQPLVTCQPEAAHPTLVARLAVGPARRPSSEAFDLFLVAVNGDTQRGPFDHVPGTPLLVAQLQHLARRCHCRIDPVRDVQTLRRVAHLTTTAEPDQRRRPRVPDELNHRPASGIGHLPATMVLSTIRDEVPSWLRAGDALQQMRLHAARYSVYASIHTQPLQTPATRARLGGLIGGRHPQALLQLGHAESLSTTLRRPMGDVLTAH